MTALWRDKRKEAAAFIVQRASLRPEIGLILGSGLGGLADEVTDAVTIPYSSIPHFPVSTVEGHAGRLVIGRLEQKPVAAMQGRFHLYEGYSMQQVAFPVWVMWELGVRTLIATNAAGGMNRAFRPGDLMIVLDHLNMTFDNPLVGPNDDELGPRFPAMRRAYSRELIDLALQVADGEGIHVQKGVYVMSQGPMYETRAMGEVFRLLGGDAVGMSTVPEIVAAVHAGMRTLAISVITDVRKENPLQFTTHEEVLAVAERTRPVFMRYVRAILRVF